MNKKRNQIHKLSDLLNFKKGSYARYSVNKSPVHVKETFNFLSLIENWPKIVGSFLAQHTIPLKNQNKTLVVLSDNSSVAQEMGLLEETIKQKIMILFPELKKNIKNIKFMINNQYFHDQQKIFSKALQNTVNKKKIFHAHSPQFKKLNKEAEELFQDVEDAEDKKLFCSLYIQSKSLT